METVVGVAIPVPEPWGSQVRSARRAYGDPLGEIIATHVTLLPPTGIGIEVLPAIREHLAQVAKRLPSFDMVLRGTGSFQPVSQVVYLTVARGVSGCEQLESAVRSGPLGRPLRFPYHPHVTLAQDVAEESLSAAYEEWSDFTCSFRVDSFSLFEEHPGHDWDATEEFRLQG